MIDGHNHFDKAQIHCRGYHYGLDYLGSSKSNYLLINIWRNMCGCHPCLWDFCHLVGEFVDIVSISFCNLCFVEVCIASYWKDIFDTLFDVDLFEYCCEQLGKYVAWGVFLHLHCNHFRKILFQTFKRESLSTIMLSIKIVFCFSFPIFSLIVLP